MIICIMGIFYLFYIVYVYVTGKYSKCYCNMEAVRVLKCCGDVYKKVNDQTAVLQMANGRKQQ